MANLAKNLIIRVAMGKVELTVHPKKGARIPARAAALARGMGSVVDVWPTSRRKLEIGNQASDAQKLAYDQRRVAGDFSDAVKSLAE